MVEFLSRAKLDLQPELQPRDVLLVGSTLEILREMREKLDNISLRLVDLERKFEERIPEKMLSENKFISEVENGDDIVGKILSEIKEATHPLIAARERLTIVETKRIERIITFCKQHERLNSMQLGQLMGLSRTRCNEYLKKMEVMGLLESELTGKEKYYKLKI